jgi:T5SS/PEP-CTERM-associated repeat protein
MVTVTGAGSSLTINPITSGIVAGREVFIGGYGTGKLIVDQGAAVHAEGTHITVSGGFFGTQTSAPGTLTVKSGSTLAAADITLNPNGTLNGDGTIAADVILNGGAISPGNSPGTLTIDGDLNAMAGAFNFELASDALRDHVNVLGTATIGQDVFFNLLFGYAPAIDEVFSLESFFTVGGGPLAFDAGFDLGSHLNVTGLSAGESIFVTANSQRVRISGPVSVPEPATIALFVSGLAAAFYAGSRARQRVRI